MLVGFQISDFRFLDRQLDAYPLLDGVSCVACQRESVISIFTFPWLLRPSLHFRSLLCVGTIIGMTDHETVQVELSLVVYRKSAFLEFRKSSHLCISAVFSSFSCFPNLHRFALSRHGSYRTAPAARAALCEQDPVKRCSLTLPPPITKRRPQLRRSFSTVGNILMLVVSISMPVHRLNVYRRCTESVSRQRQSAF